MHRWYAPRRYAISGTGQGELFIRHVFAHDIASRIVYGHESLENAAQQLIMGEFQNAGIGAGAVAIDAAGTISAPYNTLGMFRAWVNTDGTAAVASHHQVYPFELELMQAQ